MFELYKQGQISLDEAIRNADSANNLRLKIKLSDQSLDIDEVVSEEGTVSSSGEFNLSLEEIPEDGEEDGPEEPDNPFMTQRDN